MAASVHMAAFTPELHEKFLGELAEVKQRVDDLQAFSGIITNLLNRNFDQVHITAYFSRNWKVNCVTNGTRMTFTYRNKNCAVNFDTFPPTFQMDGNADQIFHNFSEIDKIKGGADTMKASCDVSDVMRYSRVVMRSRALC